MEQPARTDLRGQVFGHLVPVAPIPMKHKMAKWRCKCLKCGGAYEVFAAQLRSGKAKECLSCRGNFMWDRKSEQIILDLHAKGEPARVAAKILGCTTQTVQRKLLRMRKAEERKRGAVKEEVPLVELTPFERYMASPVERHCLCCEAQFTAPNRTIRLCRYCSPFVHGAAFS